MMSFRVSPRAGRARLMAAAAAAALVFAGAPTPTVATVPDVAVPPAAVALVAEARRAMWSGRRDEAVTLLERARDAAPRSAPVLLALVEGYAARVDQASVLGKMSYAKKIKSALETAVDAEPRNPHALFGLMQFHLQAPGVAGGSATEADRLARELGTLDPAWGHRAAAVRATRARDLERAARELRAAVALRPGDAAFGLDLSLNAQARQAWDEAHAVATKLAAAGNRPALYQVGRTGALSGERLAEAETALRTYLAAPSPTQDPLQGPSEPPQSAAWYRLGQVLAHAPGRRGEAREALQQALALDPGNAGAKKALAGLR